MRARLSAALALLAIMTAPGTAEETVAPRRGPLDGLTVMNGASAAAYQFAMFILSAEGQRTLAKHGFAAPALPQ